MTIGRVHDRFVEFAILRPGCIAIGLHSDVPSIRRSCLFGFFVPNMLKKDKSLSRYPEFAEHKRHSGLVIPKLV